MLGRDLPTTGGGAHSPAAKGVGESQFQRLEKRLALCLLCAWPRRGNHKWAPAKHAHFAKSKIFAVSIHFSWVVMGAQRSAHACIFLSPYLACA
jgi:hypothetical protein